ncbi:hypothetical protein JKP88DRAFT_284908 [Tribonema minus]|uniref:Uncharacterized protein n=1 Tax=Tribonema minus TaxID=303371 RepID=A0A835ZDF4_9STRA|nr:hypothetical protein JKP88DRAFT_284908 [Tribonema minus]
MLCSGGGHSGAGRSRWSRDPNMLKERKQLDKWRKDILYGWFMDDQEQQLSIWCDPVLSTMADPEYHAATTPAGVLQVWFGSQDPAEDAVNPHMWDTRSQELAETCGAPFEKTCGALFESALSDAAELSAFNTRRGVRVELAETCNALFETALNNTVRVELAETCGALFETALCDAAELSAWDETPQGALARVLLLGPIGEVTALK